MAEMTGHWAPYKEYQRETEREIPVASSSASDRSRIGRPLGFERPAGVVQLVRTPACHAGGRRFESGRSRTSTERFSLLGLSDSSAQTAPITSERPGWRAPSPTPL